LNFYLNKKASATIIIGPPASGKKTLSRLLAKKTGAVLLTKANLLETLPPNLKTELSKEISKNVILSIYNF
jgi:adenylate kinase family enzyme